MTELTALLAGSAIALLTLMAYVAWLNKKTGAGKGDPDSEKYRRWKEHQ